MKPSLSHRELFLLSHHFLGVPRILGNLVRLDHRVVDSPTLQAVFLIAVAVIMPHSQLIL
jgi:hypothetical protein